MNGRVIRCGGKTFEFRLDPIEKELLECGGLMAVYERFGKDLFRELQDKAARGSVLLEKNRIELPDTSDRGKKLEW